MTETSNGPPSPRFRTWMRPDGIIQVVWEPGTAIRLEDAIASTTEVAKLAGGQRRPLLVDGSATGPIDRLARMEYARREDLSSAIALILNTPLSRLSGNFLLAVSRPKPPTRLFGDEATAVAWLSDFLPQVVA